MTDLNTPADIEADLIATLQHCRQNPQRDGTPWGNRDFEGYAEAIQTRILLPLIAKRVAAGEVGPLDDLGHDTDFVAAWNRAVAGKAERWDHRELAIVYLRAARDAVPGEAGDVWEAIMSGNMDKVDQALISRLPDILCGHHPANWEAAAIASTYNGAWLDVRFDGLQPVLLNEDGTALTAPEDLPGHFPLKLPETSNAVFGLISFHGDTTEHNEGMAAWECWREELARHDLGRRHDAHSMMAYAVRNMAQILALGISEQVMRQDEAISIDIRNDGVVVYRGAVEGLKVIADEGQFLCGARQAFVDVLVQGGFTPEDADSYLTRLAQTDSAFEAAIPEGSAARVMIDAETLFGLDHAPDDMVRADRVDAAVPIWAAGTFPMPEMPTHRERKRRAEVETPAPA